jgi:hypothetical protein
VVAPVTAGVAAVVPALYGLVAGERPSAVASCGVVVALLAIFIVSRAPHASGIEVAAGWTGSRGLPEAIAAGMGFGAFFIFLSNASPDSGVWPLVGARLASLALLWLLVAALPGTVSIRKETNVLILALSLRDPARPAHSRGGFVVAVSGRHRVAGPGGAARTSQPDPGGRRCAGHRRHGPHCCRMSTIYPRYLRPLPAATRQVTPPRYR